MKGTHPELVIASARCATCGSEYAFRSTRSELAVDTCSNCHPAYTGTAPTVARGSRIDRFEQRCALAGAR
jgi:large subunit ribosomal protein L31